MAIVLFPPETFNEKFLLTMRDCVLKLQEDHPVKRWLKWVAKKDPPSKKEQEINAFLTEMLNTKFNLITDVKVKNRIINILSDIPEKTIGEKILKSYLYLMIGNITKSDNILKQMVSMTPFESWKGSEADTGIYHSMAVSHMEQILAKLSKHPADRKTFELFNFYLRNYANDPILLELLSENETSQLDNKLDLRFTERLAPSLVRFLRVQGMSESRRIKQLKNNERYSLKEQAYWIWPFLDADPFISPEMLDELIRIEKEDPLWFIYLMDHEKLIDRYSKKVNKAFLFGRRHYLRSLLEDPHLSMLALYKLIEFGDIDHSIVQKTVDILTHE